MYPIRYEKISRATVLKSRQFFVVLAFCAVIPSALLAQAFTTLASFDGTNGAAPIAPLVQGTDGNFYGTASGGGVNLGNGTGGSVFKITPGGTVTVLYSFCVLAICADGASPQGGLIQASDGSFYGTTASGGTNNAGSVFKITAGGVLTTLYSFCPEYSPELGCADGTVPWGELTQASDGTSTGRQNRAAPLVITVAQSSRSLQVARWLRCTALVPKAAMGRRRGRG